jgi:cytochrome c6
MTFPIFSFCANVANSKTSKLGIHTLPILLVASSLLGLPAHAADEAAQMMQGKALFTNAVPACAVCHTLKDAGAEGAVGPILDEIKPDSARIVKALRNGLGNMPSYKAILTEDQIAALARYVSRASGAEK